MGPEIWFGDELLSKENVFGLSFDFFVNWETLEISPSFWLKFRLDDTISYEELLDDLENEVLKVLTLEKQQVIVTLSNNHKINFELIIFNDSLDWGDNNSDILKVKVNSVGSKILLVPNKITLFALKNQIQQYSGGAVKVGWKGLIYGTSRLECSLSHTDSLYPGDADLVLFNDQKETIAILEYKKHNLHTPIENQQLSNYYPRPDKRKYDRLSFLSHFLGRDHPLPIIVIYYPTKPNTIKGKIELLDNREDNITTMANGIFELTDSKGEQGVLARVLKAINYFHSKMK